MAEQAIRDQNHVTAMLFKGSDGATYNAQGDEATGRLKVDNSGGGSGTVTEVSVVTANGFAGTVATATTTPAITLTTSINAPVLAGNGTAIAAATTTGSGSTVVLSDTPTLVTPILGTPTSVTLTNATGLPVSTGISGLGTGVATALAVNVGSAGAFVVLGGALGTPSSGTGTNITGIPAANILAGTFGTGAYVSDTSFSAPTIIAGSGAAAGVVTSNGNFDLTLQTGNATTGSINITDGADGLIAITPNGTGNVSLGNMVFDADQAIGVGQDNYVLTYDNATGLISLEAAAGGGANTALSNLSAVAINTTLVSDTDNTDALGTTAIAWSDLFLGSGGVITFNSAPSTPDITLTHSANTLTFDGGTFAMGTNSITLTGSIAATGARVTKGWFTDIESTNMPTVGGTAILTSLTAPQFTTIELGHATDTTLSRVSAGVIAVEGVTVPTISSTNTLTNKRITRRVVSVTDSATPTINTDNTDIASLTGLSQAVTSFTTNLSGTPSSGDYLMIQITDNGTARALTWGASFQSTASVTLPTTTVVSTLLRVGFQWNATASKWDCIAVA